MNKKKEKLIEEFEKITNKDLESAMGIDLDDPKTLTYDKFKDSSEEAKIGLSKNPFKYAADKIAVGMFKKLAREIMGSLEEVGVYGRLYMGEQEEAYKLMRRFSQYIKGIVQDGLHNDIVFSTQFNGMIPWNYKKEKQGAVEEAFNILMEKHGEDKEHLEFGSTGRVVEGRVAEFNWGRNKVRLLEHSSEFGVRKLVTVSANEKK